MRIFLSILAFILSLVVVKFALAFIVAAFGVTEVKGGEQLLINIVSYGLALFAARAFYKRVPQGTPKKPVQVTAKEEPKDQHTAAPRANKSQPWLAE